jgi:hypothetical protein
MTGVYTFTVQNEDFTTKTEEIPVGVDERGYVATPDGDDDETRVCQIRGHFVQESFDADVKGYSQSRIYVTNMGLTTLPLFYDKAALDAAGIPSKVFEVPGAVAKVLGRDATALVESALTRVAVALEPTLGLMVDNGDAAPAAVLAAGHAGPVGLTLIRK